MRKKLFTFLLALVTSVGMSWAQNPSGSCGENVTWELNTSTGALTITGSGAMEVYSSYYIPWKNYKSSITSVVITNGVTSVSQYSFSQCENLTSVTIGDDVETIGQFTFNDCGSSFTSLTIGNSVQSIGMAAFLNAKWITELTLPSTLQTIGSYALCNLKALATITIPSSVTSIEASAFSGCTALTSIYVEATNPPTMGNDVFASITGKAYIPLYVPNGSVAAYTAAAQWNEFDIHGYDPSDPGSGEEPGGDDPSTGDGSLSGAFTINEYGDQINFSKGNLQYVSKWQFAANQWDIIGAAQADNNRDLFGWGTGDAPNKVSMDLDDYAEYHEWGTNMGDGWRTLSRDEWTYLFQTRTNAADLYAPANVNGVNGFVVLPDDWTLPYGMTFTTGVKNYGTNVYQNAGWKAMEDAGAVFLPVAGYRYNGNINWVGQSGYYWSSTEASAGASAWSWLISASSGARRDYYNLFYGMPVRLIKAVVKSDQEFADPVIALIEAIGTVEYTQVCKNRIVEARVAYDHLTDAQKALVSNYSTLTDAEEAYAALTPPPATDGSLSGAFTINGDGDQINFSKGNLQYVGSWQFAANQWNIIGNDQADNNRDLFGWGTGDAPNKVSTTLADYAEYHEWGENMGDGWYTLSKDEWIYLFQSRTNAANLYAPANVNGVNGYVILPDEWVQPYGTTFTPGVTNYGTNVYADAAWTSMEDAGAVFLPVDGYRYNGNSIKWVGQTGWYWSSTEANVDATAWCWQLDKDNVEVQYSYNLDYGMCVRLVKAASSTPSGPTYLDADFAINFMTDPYTVVGGGDLPAGVAVEGSMNTGDAQHGYRLPVITIPVTAGNYKVMMGTCKWSNQDGFVKTEDGSYTYATLATNNGTCYDQAPATNVVGAIFNVPSDQIIKVYGAEYTPFFSIEKMAAVPAFTDFEINFQSDPYNVISGAKPAGTEIAGTYNDKLHGYQNVVATVPVEAGAYRLTLGACEFGNGAGNVMSETNVELASFNQNLGTGNCYHNNPATNIVSMTFNVDADQHIVIDCGTYTPYMKLEKISAYTVQFALGDAEGSAPAAVNVNVGEDITMPVNQTMYKAGYTLTGWTDGVSTYAIGEPFIPTSDALLTPVFTANAVAITEAAEEVTVRWYFGKSNNAPDFAWQNNNGFLIAQAIVGGNPIDVRLDVNATSGKFSNAGRDDQWAQVNSGTAFAYPYKEGMTVDVNTYSGNETYDLAAGTLTCNTNDYYSFIEVTYPAPAPTDEQVPTNADPENPSYHYSTFFHSTQNYKLTNDGTEAFIANLSAGDLVLTEIAKGTQVIPANTAVILRKNGSADPVVLTPTEENGVSVNPDDNDLQGVDEATTLESLSIDPQKCYVLSGKSHDETVTGVGFYRIYGTTLKAHKAYVIYNGSVNSNLAPRRMRFVFNTATGVESAQPSVISGQKLIENGQLIIIKNGVRYNAQGQIVK